MAQPPKQAIPPAPPTDPNAGKNIHGQPNTPPNPNSTEAGHGPQPDMAPPENAPKGLADNTRAEMEAGKKHLEQHAHRHDAEHETGRKVIQQHSSQK
jgi:hypothetical protein